MFIILKGIICLLNLVPKHGMNFISILDINLQYVMHRHRLYFSLNVNGTISLYALQLVEDFLPPILCTINSNDFPPPSEMPCANGKAKSPRTIQSPFAS